MTSIQVDVLITVSINTEVWWKHFATPSSTTLQFSPMIQSLINHTGLNFILQSMTSVKLVTSLRTTINLPPSIAKREKRSDHNFHSYAPEDTPICLEAHVSQLELNFDPTFCSARQSRCFGISCSTANHLTDSDCNRLHSAQGSSG